MSEGSVEEASQLVVVEGAGERLESWYGWRNGLPERVVRSIPEGYVRMLDKAAENREKMRGMAEEKRIAVVIVARDAACVLPNTVKEITEQMKTCGLYGEVFVVLNGGGGDTKECLKKDEEEIKASFGVDRVIKGRAHKRSDGMSLGEPNKIELDGSYIEGKGEIRLIVVDQEDHPDNLGKVRGQRDIYNYLLEANNEGYCPKWLLAIDAETRLRKVDPHSHRVITNEAGGLGELLKATQGGERIVGAKLHFVPYGDDGNPDWEVKVPPMQKTVSLLHGSRGFEWCPGGATLGEFTKIVPIAAAMGNKLPGSRIEDNVITVTARTMGVPTLVHEGVVHTNRCPGNDEPRLAYEQIKRWMKGQVGLERAFGRDLTRLVLNPRLDRVIINPLIKAFKRDGQIRVRDIPYLLQGLPPYLSAIRQARLHPDDYFRGDASW